MVEDVILSALAVVMNIIVVCVQLSLQEHVRFSVVLFLFVLITSEVGQEMLRAILILVVFIVKLLLSGHLYSACIYANDGLPFRFIMVLRDRDVVSLP